MQINNWYYTIFINDYFALLAYLSSNSCNFESSSAMEYVWNYFIIFVKKCNLKDNINNIIFTLFLIGLNVPLRLFISSAFYNWLKIKNYYYYMFIIICF